MRETEREDGWIRPFFFFPLLRYDDDNDDDDDDDDSMHEKERASGSMRLGALSICLLVLKWSDSACLTHPGFTNRAPLSLGMMVCLCYGTESSRSRSLLESEPSSSKSTTVKATRDSRTFTSSSSPPPTPDQLSMFCSLTSSLQSMDSSRCAIACLGKVDQRWRALLAFDSCLINISLHGAPLLSILWMGLSRSASI